MNLDLTTVVSVLLGGGAVATLTAGFKGITALRSGARAREREAVDDLGRWRDELDRARRATERDRDYWRLVASRYAAQLVRAGIDPVPSDPVPPSERAG